MPPEGAGIVGTARARGADSPWSLRSVLILAMGVLLAALAGSQMGIIYSSPLKFLTLACASGLLLIQRRLRNEPLIYLLVLLCVVSNARPIPGLNYVNFANYTLFLLILGSMRTDLIREILSKYSQVMFFLVAVSLPFFAVQMLAFDVIRLLPITMVQEVDGHNTGYFHFHNALVWTANVQSSDFRNRSIFWEPGVFFYNMIIALYWQFFEEGKGSLKRFLVYAGGFLTCLSTSGLLALPFIAWEYFFSRHKVGWKKYAVPAVAILVGAAAVAVFSDFFMKYTFGKFSMTNVSFFDRTTSTLNAVQLFLAQPVLGQGLVQNVFVTSAFFQLLYQLGGVFTGIFFLFVFRYFRGLSLLVRIPVFILWVNSEALAFAYVTLFMMAFGLKTSRPWRLGRLLLRSHAPAPVPAARSGAAMVP